MSQVRGKDTKLELRVRSYLHAAGLRYVLHDKRLPGKPDLSFPSRRVAVFVHGCFWHGHEGCKRAHLPTTRPEFWRAKIKKNKDRDLENLKALENLGWQALIFWQCAISDISLDGLACKIRGYQPHVARPTLRHSSR